MAANSSSARESSSKKSFLDLPPELRNIIYELVISTYRKPSYLYPAKRVEVDNRGRIEFPQNALGATCRKIHNDFTPIYKCHVQTVATLVADVDEFRFQAIVRRLEKLFPSKPADTASGKRKLVLNLSFESPENEPDLELLVQWLEYCEKGGVIAAFTRSYYVSFDWSRYRVRDVWALQDRMQALMVKWRGKDDYVGILHAMVDVAGERDDPCFGENFEDLPGEPGCPYFSEDSGID